MGIVSCHSHTHMVSSKLELILASRLKVNEHTVARTSQCTYCNLEFPTSITKRYLTSDFASLSMAVLIWSILTSSMSAAMLCLAQKSNISCVSFIPPTLLPPTSLRAANTENKFNTILRRGHSSPKHSRLSI